MSFIHIEKQRFPVTPTVVKVIMTSQCTTGLGKLPDDPIRRVYEIYTLDGGLICSIDDWQKDES